MVENFKQRRTKLLSHKKHINFACLLQVKGSPTQSLKMTTTKLLNKIWVNLMQLPNVVQNIQGPWGSFLAYRPILPVKVTISHAVSGRKKASPTPKNRISSAQLCYSTCRTWVGVTHPNTNQAQHCLTSVIEWELAFQSGYGRRALLG